MWWCRFLPQHTRGGSFRQGTSGASSADWCCHEILSSPGIAGWHPLPEPSMNISTQRRLRPRHRKGHLIWRTRGGLRGAGCCLLLEWTEGTSRRLHQGIASAYEEGPVFSVSLENVGSNKTILVSFPTTNFMDPSRLTQRLPSWSTLEGSRPVGNNLDSELLQNIEAMIATKCSTNADLKGNKGAISALPI